MSGGVAQLVAIGAQDAHLVGNPEVSFFRSQYKRHTNFSSVVERQVIQGNPGSGGLSTVRFERKGDLLSYLYLTKKNSSGEIVEIGLADINKIELLIGGQVIDTIDSNFSSNIASTLCASSFSRSQLYNIDGSTRPTFYPLLFWFCEHYQAALPLVCLQYHDVEVRITWATVSAGTSYEMWAKFIYLDTQEREELVKTPQMMLIYQNQKAIQSGTKTQELNFNHPIKFLASTSNLFDSLTTTTSIRLQINGVDIGDAKPMDPHFTRAPYYYHTDTDYTNYPEKSASAHQFLYPFCLNTNKLQPTGSLNFSRLDSVRLITDSANGFNQCPVYGVNYNILKIQNGMGGLLYAN